MKRKNNKGFTLIELLAVIVILGIILTIVVSNVTKYIKQARTGSYKDAYQIIIKDLRTELLANEMNTGTASLTSCDDDSTQKCSSTYSDLYDSKNISLTITSVGSGYNIVIKPTNNSSFKSATFDTTTVPKNTTVSAATSGQTEGNILNTTMSSSGDVSATTGVTNSISTKSK